MEKITVLIADGQRLLAEALVASLGREVSLDIATPPPTTGSEALAMILEISPDVAVVDCWLPRMNGLAVAAAVRARSPRQKILIMGASVQTSEVIAALDAGATGVVPKTLTVRELHDAIEQVHRGLTPVGVGPLEDVAVADLERMLRSDDEHDRAGEPWRRLASLTPREIDVLEELNRTPDRQDAAAALGIARKTVATHIENILAKTGTRSQMEAVAMARDFGVISPAPTVKRDYSVRGYSAAPATPSQTITLLVADAQPLFADALALAAGAMSDIHVLDERPQSADAAIHAIRIRQPDVAVIDYWMPGMAAPGSHGVLAEMGGCNLVVTSWMHGARHVKDALAGGAAAFLPKSVGLQILLEAVRRAATGERPVFGEALDRFIAELDRRESVGEPFWDKLRKLTPQERKILRLLSLGLAIPEVGRELHISRSTVNVHIRNILAKTGARSHLEAVAMAGRYGVQRPR